MRPSSERLHVKSKKKKRNHKDKGSKATPSTDAGRQRKLQAQPVKGTLGKQHSELKQQKVPNHGATQNSPSLSKSRGAPSQLEARAGKSSSKAKGMGLLERMRQRLQGGRFRWLNEKLYTCQGSEALTIMSEEPDLYTQYHEGFREQTKGWPVQPVDVAINWLKQQPVSWIVADLGCGDARLASGAPQQRVRSFDLVATAPGVEACNMAQLPLQNESVDAAVFCLSLMGTDYGSFLEEATRVLRPGGWLWIAEVQSRFVNEAGGNVIKQFIAAVTALGLDLKDKNLKNPFFLNLVFQREFKQQEKRPSFVQFPGLRACQYKKR